MPSIYDLKPAFQNMLRPIVVKLAARGITPNQVTVFGVVLCALAGGWILWVRGAVHWLWVVPLVLFLRMAVNAMDGMLAREHDMQTAMGGLLNEISDVASDALVYLPLAIVPVIPPPLVVMVVVCGCIAELAGLAGVAVGASRRYDGPMGKSDRAFWLSLLCLLLAVGVPAGPWIDLFLSLVVVASLVTIVRRMQHADREVSL